MPPKANNKGPGTPGRSGKALRSNQYFDVGKVGRKTGITLKDTGVRDEHGLEPVSGIFSSPDLAESSPRRKLGGEDGSSAGMDVEESSAPSVEQTLNMRKTPRFPPPRAQTPRKSGIAGSPKRMSTGRGPRHQSEPAAVAEEVPSPRLSSQPPPPPNRILDFAGAAVQGVRTTLDSLSPFKPKRNLRRSAGPSRPDPFAVDEQPEEDAADEVVSVGEPTEDGAAENRIAQDGDSPVFLPDEEFYIPDSPGDQIREESATAEEPILSSPSRRKRSTPPASARSGKRSRSSLEADGPSASPTEVHADQRATKMRRPSRSSKSFSVVIHQRDGEDVIAQPSEIAAGDEYQIPVDETSGVYEEPPAVEEQQENPEPETKPQPQQKRKRGRPRKVTDQKTAPKPGPKPRENPQRANRKRSSGDSDEPPASMRQTLSPSKRSSVGPTSNVNLRATTPYEDAGSRVSRYGRPVMQPLKFWQNEAYVWKQGQIEGVIRAEDVEQSKIAVGGKRGWKRRQAKLGTIAEDDVENSDAESILPDEWEEEMGVISGMVASWDAEAGMGDPHKQAEEDLAFAATAIVTRDVANSAFTFAKIMTLPFFGSGIVELPPEGYKRTKNSRRMHMVFFVHEGKVNVQVGGTAGVPGAVGDGLVQQFNISKGGVWVVPRGNNYSITNESRTKKARMFFAQGCEVPAVPSREDD